MNKILSLSALMLIGFVGSAHAATVQVTLGATGSDLAYSAGGALNPNIDLSTIGGSLVLTNAQVINPATSVANQYTQPTGALFANSYLAVLGDPIPGSALYTLPSGQHSFGFTWGTIDAYNTLVLTDSRNVVYTITGTDILNQIIGSTTGSTQSDVNFIDSLGTIVKAELLSTQNSFEAGNFGQSAVPLPAALPLFGMGLLGLAALRRRKAAKA